jgi:hypothetical protein
VLSSLDRQGTRSDWSTRRTAITALLKSPPPLKLNAVVVKLQAPLGNSSEGRVTFFCLLVTFFVQSVLRQGIDPTKSSKT